MAPLRGFSDNPFRTRDDFISAGVALIEPLQAYKSPNHARIKIPTATGTSFSEDAAQLEGFARPLLLLAPLLHVSSPELANIRFGDWVDGLRSGTDPQSPEYWGDLGDFDQRMVEMESIAYALLSAPDTFTESYDETARSNLVAWLGQINSRDMSRNNWRWFRILVNLALARVLGVDVDDGLVRGDLEVLDSFYLGDGWSADGAWCDERKQVDYYSGSFAIQLSQLLYVRFAPPELDPERTARYRDQARMFAAGFWRYFDVNGAAIPFGRSLTYRFAMAAFWSAVTLADVQLDAPLDDPGVVKGLLLRHLRWWSAKPDIFNLDGTLNIGFTYPNMYLSEDYNSPQSVYWCLKSFIIAHLPADHPFWASEELPHPMAARSPRPAADVALLPQPRHIVCSTREHHFLLSSGQATTKNHKGREAKYGKLAYSSSRGFSVPVGCLLEQVAPDSALAVSIDGGGSWKVSSDPHNLGGGDVTFAGETVPTLSCSWKPYPFLDVEVRTSLIPPVRRYPGWHLRIHQVQLPGRALPVDEIRLVDCGFAASAETSLGSDIYERPCSSDITAEDEGWWATGASSLVVSRTGSSGIVDLTGQFTGRGGEPSIEAGRTGVVIKPHANTNVLTQRTLIPSLQGTISCRSQGRPNVGGQEDNDSNNRTYLFVTAVFAVDEGVGSAWDMWRRVPLGRLHHEVDGSLSIGDTDQP